MWPEWSIAVPAKKVTLTVPAGLLDAVDRYVAAHPGATRSGVCATALREWLRAEQEAQIEQYYGELSPDERREDAARADAAGRSAAGLWP